jgi:hypothetical protein
MFLGLTARRFSVYLPNFINIYLGDTLWSLMVFFMFGFIFKTKETRWVAFTSLLFSFSIEISQLYHSPWIDSLRRNRVGGLILGYGFLWSDLVAYTIGIGIGMFIEKIIFFHIKKK